jgi:hypothetical protein
LQWNRRNESTTVQKIMVNAFEKIIKIDVNV